MRDVFRLTSILGAILALSLTGPFIGPFMGAQALTIKKGQVIGADGGVYDGASPEQKEVYINRAKEGGNQADLVGRNVFVVVQDDITFVPVGDLVGKSKKSQLNTIGDTVIEKLTGPDSISFEQLTELQDIATENGVALEDLMKVDNALGALDEELAAIITDEIDTPIQDGALEQVQAFLESDVLVENLSTIAQVTQRVEAELGELATELDYYNACLESSDAATCDSIAEEMSEIGG